MMRSCPLCRLFMEQVQHGDAVFWTCAHCGGAWLPHQVADAIRREAPEVVRSAVEGSRTAETLAFAGLARACPECMVVTLDAEDDAAETLGTPYRCPRCGGVWLERLAEPPAQSQPVAVPEPTTPAVVEPPAPPSSQATAPVPELAAEETAAPPVPLYEPPVVDSSDAWRRLEEGNQRFVEGRPVRPHASLDRVHEVADEQTPFAAVVTCSDSRVPPEIVFDRGIGDLFVVRTAGHVLTGTGVAAVLYAVDHLHVPLVVVVGHTRCGAIHAAIDGDSGEAWLANLVRALKPAVELSSHMPGSHWENAVRVHTARTVEQLRNAIAANLQLADASPVRVLGAIYDTASGKVTLLEDDVITDHPDANKEEPAEQSGGSLPGPDTSRYAVRVPVTEIRSPGTPPVEVQVSGSPPDGASASRYPRWCPRCLQGYGNEVTFCTSCGVLLVRPDYVIRCSRCGQRNAIGSDVCYHCGATLHPERRPSAFERTRRSVAFGASRMADRSQGCSTQGVLALAALLITAFGRRVVSALAGSVQSLSP